VRFIVVNRLGHGAVVDAEDAEAAKHKYRESYVGEDSCDELAVIEELYFFPGTEKIYSKTAAILVGEPVLASAKTLLTLSAALMLCAIDPDLHSYCVKECENDAARIIEQASSDPNSTSLITMTLGAIRASEILIGKMKEIFDEVQAPKFGS